MDYSIRITGEAGQGIQTIGDTLARVFARAGHYVFTHQDYESRIRGGHNFYQIRIADIPIAAPRSKLHILVALDKDGITRHEREIAPEGRIVYDATLLKTTYEGPLFLDIPFMKLAYTHGGAAITANTVATGAVLGMLGMDMNIIEAVINETFGAKGQDVVAVNQRAALAGYEFAVKECIECGFRTNALKGASRMLISGVDAIALGSIASGVKFYAAYPMTPSTGIMNYMASQASRYGLIVEQAEDEIAAVNMAIGASFAGIRSMTATSGGGFSLMIEGLALAGMTETPLVIGLGQRPGPATGLPTRTEQGELLFSIFAGHGEFPRIVFAPGTPRQAFYLTNKAFDLAEKYQIPAVILFDQTLADSQCTYDGFDLSGIRYQDYRLRGAAFSGTSEYKRHVFTETGVSPLAVPGDGRHIVVTDSDEHDEEGHMVEDGEMRVNMVKKRLLKKMPLIKNEISGPFFYGDRSADIIIAGWGSTYGVMREAVDLLSRDYAVAMLHFSELWPFPSVDTNTGLDFTALLKNARSALCIENNAMGQFSRLLRSETGFEFKNHIHKFDGRPFTVEELAGEIHDRVR